MKYLFALLPALLCIQTRSHAQRQMFSAEEVREDMAYMVTSLDQTHYDLYAYTDSVSFWHNYEAVKSEIGDDSLSMVEATSLLQKVIAAANNGHTEIDFPVAAYIPYVYGGGTVFPLEVALEGGRAFVRESFLPEGDGPGRGDELLAIEGKPVGEYIDMMQQHISAERRYFKDAKFELFTLPRQYWQHFEPKDEFSITYRDGEGNTHTDRVAAVKALDYEQNRYGILRMAPELRLEDDVAYLHPGAFSGEDIQPYRDFIDSAFSAINKRNIPHLVLDLRNHPGGDDAYSDYLIRYIADRPFKWYSTFHIRSSRILKEHTRDTTSAYSQAIHARKNGERFTFDFGPVEPVGERKRYKGEVYVLINRQSHSMSTVAAATIKDYGFGTLVGEETGEYASLHASQFGFALPATGIIVKLSKGYIIRPGGSEAREGLKPDIMIGDHLLDDEDEILDTLLNKLDQ
ncbi:S41 family peptidase [Roseivirga sp. BDSF3-8]|uniref:S41 family peptidase n=1 Tax=Roseivirga sp. BDSF3-8 TaxID=3241598 RepID=UPI0035319494